jgi:hypothetical protein
VPLLELNYHCIAPNIGVPGFAMTRWHDESGAPVAGACDGSAAQAARARRITEHPVLCDQDIDRHQGISFIHEGEDVKMEPLESGET